ncbi:MAG: single-stranded DNA-binding protein [Christensenellales bacterium]
MNTNYENNNLAHVSGTITEEPKFSHNILGEGFYDLKLSVPRLSEEYDTIPVTISERLINDLKLGDSLSIDGQFRSYNKLEDGKSKLILTLFAKELVDEDTAQNTNSINLVGYICKPPIYRTTPFGREICDCLIAVNRAYNKSDYIPCIAWGRNARFVKNLAVGEKISLTGRIQSRNYQKKLEDESIEVRTAYEISISSISLLDEDTAKSC